MSKNLGNNEIINKNMRISNSSFGAVLLAGSLFTCHSIACAAETATKADKPKMKAQAAAPANSKDRVDRLAERMSLTAEQKAKLRPLYQEEADRVKAEMQRSEAEWNRIRAEFKNKVKQSGILTDAQYAEWLALQARSTAKTSKPAEPEAAKP
jgi:hypothetical protein